MPSRYLLLLLLATLLAACSQPASPTPTPAAATPLPAIVSEPGGPVRAAGKVIPAQEANLAFTTSGQVRTVQRRRGRHGQGRATLLVALDSTTADAGVVEAQAALFRAQANLDELKAGPRTQEVTAAEANVQAAQARLDQLSTPASESEIAAARSSLAAAQAALKQLSAGPRQEERIAALADLSNAEAVLKQAQSAYNQVKDRNDVGMLPQSRDLQQATNNYEAAQARYDLLFAGPEADAVAAGRAQVQQAQAALDRLLTPATPSQVAEAEAQVRAAQAELDLLQAGARDQELAVAAVAVTEAEAALRRAQAVPGRHGHPCAVCGHDHGTYRQPRRNGAAGRRWCSRWPTWPGCRWKRPTSASAMSPALPWAGPPPLSCRRPTTRCPGKVTAIAPASTIVGGDVVYTVTIDLDSSRLIYAGV